MAWKKLNPGVITLTIADRTTLLNTIPVRDGMKAIVLNEDFNEYIWNNTQLKWQVSNKNKYTTDLLPTSENFYFTNGTLIYEITKQEIWKAESNVWVSTVIQGYRLFSGTGTPAEQIPEEFGIDGDDYRNDSTGDIYKKISDVWTLVYSAPIVINDSYISLTDDYVVTQSDFSNNTKFKINSDSLVTLTLPTLTFTEDHKIIEVMKIGIGDIVITSPTQNISSHDFNTIFNNSYRQGDFLTLEFNNTLNRLFIKSYCGTWEAISGIPPYPTLQSVTLSPDGVTWTLVFDEIVTVESTSGDCFSITMPIAGLVNFTYSSGSGTNTLVYTSDVKVGSDEIPSDGFNYNYLPSGPINGTGMYLQKIIDGIITNSSILEYPTLLSVTICENGTSWSFVFDIPVTATANSATCLDATMTTAGNINFTYVSGSGTTTLIYTGSTLVSTGDTTSDGLNYTISADGIIAATGGLFLQSETDVTIVNSSIQ